MLFRSGSEGKVQGIQPRYWARYDAAMTHEAEVQQALAWLDKPAAERPVLIALYFNDTDDAGHRDGPDAASFSSPLPTAIELIGGNHVTGARVRAERRSSTWKCFAFPACRPSLAKLACLAAHCQGTALHHPHHRRLL